MTNGGVLAANRAGFSKYTFLGTVRNGVLMSITTRLGWVSVNTWNDVCFAKPMPWDRTASRSPDRTTVITFGSASAIRPGAVTLPAASCAWAGEELASKIARLAARTGSPDASLNSRSM